MKRTVRDLYLLTGLALATVGLVAQDTDEPAQPPAQERATPPSNEGAEPASDDADAAPGAEVDKGFTPTEEILADEEVTFPVDI